MGRGLEDDLSRRDFTINALALTFDRSANDFKVIDNFKGRGRH
jgi:tRNA nucleotidyltransferase/poly(A) polymerase